MNTNKILLLEDDVELQTLIKEYLETYEYNCKVFISLIEALKDFQKNYTEYALVVLDLGLPEMDGFDVLKNMKKICNIPIIVSTARGDIGNKIYGFELGADDYLAKPYEPRELILRIELILKRFKLGNIIEVCQFAINKKTKQIFFDKKEIILTPIEYEIFIYLTDNLKQGISREEIIEATSLKSNTKDRTVDTHIRNIRAKIQDNGMYIKSVWGIGYKFTC